MSDEKTIRRCTEKTLRKSLNKIINMGADKLESWNVSFDTKGEEVNVSMKFNKSLWGEIKGKNDKNVK